jgi:hypothetical protein
MTSAGGSIGARQAREPAAAGGPGYHRVTGAPPGGAGDRSADREQEERGEQDDGVAQLGDDAGLDIGSSLGSDPASLSSRR